MSDLDDSQLREILAEFIAESREHVDEFETAMLKLERDPGDAEAIKVGFRAMHSIKGNASFLALTPFEVLTHVGESVLGRVRDGELRSDQPALVNALLTQIDVLRRLLDRAEEGAPLEGIDLRPALDALEPWLSGAAPELAASADDRADEDQGEAESLERGGGSSATIRVDVGLLDRMMNLVGELVLARNQVLAQAGEGSLGPTAQRLDLVTTQLQIAVMKTRMQPVGTNWTRFPRIVRDLCQELGKQARVVMEGRDTDLDKRIIEALQDPLIHLLRNAIDHGIETPAKRVADGKPAQATILIRGFHEGGLVNIEISDDGAGVDLDAVRARARTRLGISEADLNSHDERSLHELLFEPGFSTRESVGRLSGRGVGLDVVRTNIKGLGGSIHLRSHRRQGTTVRIQIPLTLAIIPALIVSTAEERFALPQANLIEIVRVEGRARTTGPRIDHVQGAAVLRLRGRLLPLADLGAELGLEAVLSRTSDAVSVVVLQAETGQYGLVVDAVYDTEEIVVKPLWAGLESIECYAGTTILGDGRVALILDAPGLARQAALLGERELSARARSGLVRVAAASAQHERALAGARALLLLCRGRDGGQLAIPVSTVSRLEQIPKAQVERLGQLDVVQRGDEIVPLVQLASVLDRARDDRVQSDEADAEPTWQVVLHRVDGRLAGVVVNDLVDVVEAEIALQQPATRAGILGSMIVADRATELLDVEALIRAGVPSFRRPPAAPEAEP